MLTSQGKNSETEDMLVGPEGPLVRGYGPARSNPGGPAFAGVEADSTSKKLAIIAFGRKILPELNRLLPMATG